MLLELSKRIIVAFIGIPCLLVIFYLGGPYLFGFLALFCLMGALEYKLMMQDTNLEVKWVDVAYAPFIFYLITAPSFLQMNEGLRYIITGIYSVIWFGGKVNWFDFDLDYSGMGATIIGLLYTAVLPGLIYRLSVVYQQSHIIVLLLVMIWLTDSAAYFCGIWFGKHRGVFPVSPNKSLEGFIAGLLMPFVCIAAIYSVSDAWSLRQLLLVAVSAGILGQAGDLLESKLKRYAGVKDSSDFIPGHGGVLDRFDSLLIAAPGLLFLLRIFP